MISILKLIERLDRCELDFMVVGGMAAVIHGATTTTQDLDISISMKPEEIAKLRECLKDLNPFHRMTPQRLSFLSHPDSLEGLSNLYLRTDLGVLDVVGDLSLVGEFTELYARADTYDLSEKQVRVISLPDLIALKKRLARDKDLLVLKELEVLLSKRK